MFVQLVDAEEASSSAGLREDSGALLPSQPPSRLAEGNAKTVTPEARWKHRLPAGSSPSLRPPAPSCTTRRLQPDDHPEASRGEVEPISLPWQRRAPKADAPARFRASAALVPRAWAIRAAQQPSVPRHTVAGARRARRVVAGRAGQRTSRQVAGVRGPGGREGRALGRPPPQKAVKVRVTDKAVSVAFLRGELARKLPFLGLF